MKKFLGELVTSAVLTAALVACAPMTSDGTFAPSGTPRGENSVDGLIVGHRLMAAGEYELALDVYRSAALTHGLNVDVLSAVGSANLRLGRLGQAERNLRDALEKDDTFVPAWNNLGVVLMETGRYAEAARVFRAAFAIDSGATPAIAENLQLALAKAGDPAYDLLDKTNYSLIRRGTGEYLLLATP